MFRFLLSAFAIFLLLFVNFALPGRVAASRCGEKPPETLLSLYRNSSAIYIASFDKSDDLEITEDNADYSVVNIKKHFSISSALKGENRKFFVQDDQEYRYKNQTEASAGSEGDDVELGDDEYGMNRNLKPGDSLLLFLKNGEDGKTPELTDDRDGVKKLSSEHIGVYEARIKELNAIFFDPKKVSDPAIVDWLVRLIDDPITRWEGSYELVQSFDQLEWRETQARERAELIARGETVEEEAVETDEHGTVVDTSVYARLLSDGQKHAMSNLLLNREKQTAENAETQTDKTLPEGDRLLIDLVKRWGDPRVASYLLDQLKNSSDDNYLKADMMTSIAGMLSDDGASALSQQYSEISYQDDDAEVEGAEVAVAPMASDAVTIASEAAAVDAALEVVVTDAIATTTRLDEIEPANPASATENAESKKPAKATYREMRTETLSKFLRRAERVLAKRNGIAQLETGL